MNEQRDFFDEWFKAVRVKLLWKHLIPASEVNMDGRLDDWYKKLFFRGNTPEQAAAIIQRAYKLYIKHD